MTRLLYLPDDQTVISLTVDLSPAELSAAINAGMRPLPILRAAPPGQLQCSQAGATVIVAPAPAPGHPPETSTDPHVTRRQAQVLELYSRGFNSAEIAAMLGISRRAVNYHLARTRRRLRHEVTEESSPDDLDE